MLTRIRRISDNSIHTFETPIGETMLVAYEVLRMGLIRVLGVLLRAKLEGELVSVKEAMQALRADAGFFIADDLFEATLTEAGEQ
jgi:predicted nucleic acid-binding protein